MFIVTADQAFHPKNTAIFGQLHWLKNTNTHQYVKIELLIKSRGQKEERTCKFIVCLRTGAYTRQAWEILNENVCLLIVARHTHTTRAPISFSCSCIMK